ncbi:RNA methyltransferase tRNA(m5U54)methyltransferase [Orbilia brochopaga]|uniref:tRNA (guanine(26)-N(2))-dimethyltransferase n=1 Tax=Orbilia brochopaga TaxID=3140254 RepID=A0AAV9UJU2_9PEZI
MAKRKADDAVAAATVDSSGADISIPDAPSLADPTPPGGQAQARQTAPPKSKTAPDNRTPPLETTVVDGITYKVQPEGLASILLPDAPREKNTAVFYNYIQQFNRDLTMAVTRGFGELLDAERRASKRRHRGGVKHKKKRRKSDDGPDGGIVVAEHADEADEDDAVHFTVDGAGDVGMTDAAAATADATTPPPRFAVLDALSATGLRALRYAKEIPFVTHVTANDMSYDAVESIARNIAFNNVGHLVTPSLDNAVGHMYRTAYPAYVPAPTPENPNRMKATAAQKYHVIDLDPYGTATPFIDSALQALEDGGLLSVTCTDAAIFASTSYPEKTFATYGGLPPKGDFSHESGLRMVLMSIATAAGRYGLHVEPLLSLSIDYYCRVFVRVRRSPENVKKLASRCMTLLNCDSGCGAWKVQEMGTMRERQGKKDGGNGGGGSAGYKYGVAQAVESGVCEFCGYKMHVAGPMWSDPIHSAGFINHLLSNVLGSEVVKGYGTYGRIMGMLKLALGELAPTPEEDTRVPAATTTTTTTTITAAGALEDTANGELEATPAPGQAPPQSTDGSDGSAKQLPTLKRKLMQRNKQAPTTTATTAGNVPSSAKRNPTADPIALFVMPTQLARVLHCEAPSLAAIRGALLTFGYHVTKSHCRAGSLKTDAPWSVIWRVMRAWVKTHPVKPGSVTAAMPGYRILYGDHGDEALDDIHFDEALGRERDKAKGEVAYQLNPNAYWGPMAKAGKRGLTAEELSRVGNAEKDRRRKEEKERRMREGVWGGRDGGPEVDGKRKRRRGGRKAVGEEPPATAVDQVDNVAVAEETPARTKESDDSGVQYGMAGISASDLQQLEEQATAAQKACE